MSVTENGNEELRQAYASLSVEARPTDDCPPAERIWSALRGDLPAKQRREIGMHAIACPACGESWRLARDVGAGLPARDVEAGEIDRSRPWWTGWPGLAAAAAALVLVVFLFQLPGRHGETPGPTLRAMPTESLVSLLPDDPALRRDAFVLRWSGPGGARYDVRVATEDLRVLARGEDLGDGEFRVEAEALADLPSGTLLIWQVEAKLAGGGHLDNTFSVTLE